MPNDLSAFNAEVWSRSLIENLDPINVMLGNVNREWEGELRNLGDTVQVRTLGNITMTPYTRGATITYQNLAPIREPMVINDAQALAFAVDDLDAAQNDINAINAYTSRAAVSMNDVVEKKLLSNWAAAHADNKITGAADADIALTDANVYDYFVEARTRLSKKNVPATGRWAVVDPDTVALLLKDTTHFVRATDIGDQIVRNGTLASGTTAPGFIGRIAGFNVFESNNVPVDGTSKYLQFGDPFAIAYVAQLTEMEALRLQATFASAVRALLLHDTHVFAENSKRLATIKAAA